MHYNYLILLILLLFSCFRASSQIVIPMQYDGGVYKVACKVNGAKMKMIFDTGASEVSLSFDMAQYLYENDYISDFDFIESGKTQIADGRIVDHMKINIRDFEIGGQHLANVTAIVMLNQSAPLLMGQSAIKKLGRIQIEDGKLVILDSNNDLTDEQVDNIAEIADAAMKDKDYHKAEGYYSKLYNSDRLSDYGKSQYAWACGFNGDYKMELKLLRELEKSDFNNDKNNSLVLYQINIYYRIASCYIDLEEYDWVHPYAEKAVKIIPAKLKLKNGKGEVISSKNTVIPIIYNNLAASLFEKEQYSNAAQYYWKGFCSYAQYYNISTDKLWRIMLGTIKNVRISTKDGIQRSAFNYAESKWNAYEYSDSEFKSIVIKMARNNNTQAKVFCNENGIEY